MTRLEQNLALAGFVPAVLHIPTPSVSRSLRNVTRGLSETGGRFTVINLALLNMVIWENRSADYNRLSIVVFKIAWTCI